MVLNLLLLFSRGLSLAEFIGEILEKLFVTNIVSVVRMEIVLIIITENDMI